MRIAVAGATGRVGRHVVDVAKGRGHEVVPMSRATGVDVITGAGLADALTGVDVIIDTATSPSPDQETATQFFTTASRNLHEAGSKAGVSLMVVVSIIHADRLAGGYSQAVVAHERAALAGPIPVRLLRAAQFYELVEQMMSWGRQGDVAYVPNMLVRPAAARTVAEALVDLATAAQAPAGPIPEIAGPQTEQLADLATRFAARRGDPSSASATPTTRTPRPTSPVSCCPRRTPSSRARRSRNGWTPTTEHLRRPRADRGWCRATLGRSLQAVNILP